MKKSKQSCKGSDTQIASALCAEFGPEDGLDPRYRYKDKPHKMACQHTLRLCSEVEKVLSLVLSGEMSNPLLQSLQVVGVEAETGTQILRVYIALYEQDSELDVTMIIPELKNIQGYLRSSIAQRVNRKRVPALNFVYAGLVGRGSCNANSENYN